MAGRSNGAISSTPEDRKDPAVPEAQEPFERNIFQRMAAVMRDVDYIQKEKKAGMKYSIVSHDAVTAKVRPLMVTHGIIYYPMHLEVSQSGNRTQMHGIVRFQNIDDGADYMDVATAGYGVDDQDKGPGKAISYMVKYAILKALGLESGDDPDDTQDEKADHKSPVFTALKLTIDMADLASLPGVGRQIAEKQDEITKVQLAELRTLFSKRKRALEDQADGAASQPPLGQ